MPDPKPALIIAIGDLHGHYRALERLLVALEKRHGIFRNGGAERLRDDVQLVFTGDYIDRGRHALKIIDRLQRLADLNPGQIITLMGNHELMALEEYDVAVGMLRDATGTKRTLTAAYARATDHGYNGGTEFIREFGGTSLSAFGSYVTRMARTGDIGRWMRKLRPAHKATIAGRSVLFTHADVPAVYREQAALDTRVSEIEVRMNFRTDQRGGSRSKWAELRRAGMFWDRAFSALAGASQAKIDAICQSAGVDFIVTGHTQHQSIKVYRKRIFNIDVGMTPAYGENMPRALAFSPAGIVGLAADGTEQRYVRFE